MKSHTKGITNSFGTPQTMSQDASDATTGKQQNMMAGLVAKKVCRIFGCGKPAKSRGMCQMHSCRYKRYGDPLLTKQKRRDRKGVLTPSILVTEENKCIVCGITIKSPLGKRICSFACYYRRRTGTSPFSECVICGKVFKTTNGSVACAGECEKENRIRKLKAWHSEQRKSTAYLERRRLAEQRRRARKANGTVEEFTFIEIGNRDAWTCGLCGKRVKRLLKWPNHLSPTIDHIKPISKGGEHVRSNVQIAHLSCNKKKSDKEGYQLLLYG